MTTLFRNEINQLQIINQPDIQAWAKNYSEKGFANYLVNYFCYNRNRVIAALSRTGNKYKVYIRNENKLRNRQEKEKIFEDLKEAKNYLNYLLNE